MVMSATSIAIKWGSDGVKTWLSPFAGAIFTTPPVQAGSSTWSTRTSGGLLEVELLEVELLGVELLGMGLLGAGLFGAGLFGAWLLEGGLFRSGLAAGRLPLGTMLELEALAAAVDAATECDPPINPTVTSPPTRAAMADIKPAAAVMAPGRDRQNRRFCPCATV
jgi:hypothetical protein